MEKNRSLRTASGLFVLVLLTICVVGATYAKYTTAGTASDTARVAKWGVTVTATGNAFATEYKTDDTNVSGTIANSVVTATGTDADGKKLVAPGTSGTLLDTSITGKPEVAVGVTADATLTLNGWSIPAPTTDNPSATKPYCPIVITIDNVDYKMGAADDTNSHTYATIEGFQNAINSALDKTQNYEPNTALTDNSDFKHKVTWAWGFTDGTADAYQTDAKDTALANLTTAPTIKLDYTATVTQID